MSHFFHVGGLTIGLLLFLAFPFGIIGRKSRNIDGEQRFVDDVLKGQNKN